MLGLRRLAGHDLPCGRFPPRPGRRFGYVMCMQPAAWPEPDPQIAAAIAVMYGTRKTARPLAVLIRDRLGEWLRDEVFAAAFGDRGRPGWSPSRPGLATVLQRAENLTDRLAADAVRLRLDWKYLLGLPVDDPGFDHTVLAEFRGRVADSGLEQVVLDALLSKLAAGGLVKAGGRQRTDSTHVIAAVAALNRLELAGESVRAVLEALTAAHPARVAQRICVPGIYQIPSYARSYPDGSIAANIIGFTSTNKKNGVLTGEAGLEEQANALLAGQPGSEQVQISTDGQQIPLAGSNDKPVVNGSDLQLTIVPALQYAAEQACQKQVAKTKASNCTVVIIQPHTGDVLAMAQYPTFDPSNVTNMNQTTNLAVQAQFQPGSTAKVITASAAFEHGGRPEE